MSRRRQTTSDQTIQWINEKFIGPKRKKAIAELERLEAEHGRLVPAVIVDAARDRRSPLHGFFEWNDTVAAEKYRLIQAATLVRHVKVTIQTPDRKSIEVRAYVSPYKGQGYVSVLTALNDDEMRQQMLAQARADLEAFTTRYQSLQELDEVFSVISQTLKTKKKKRVA